MLSSDRLFNIFPPGIVHCSENEYFEYLYLTLEFHIKDNLGANLRLQFKTATAKERTQNKTQPATTKRVSTVSVLAMNLSIFKTFSDMKNCFLYRIQGARIRQLSAESSKQQRLST